MEEKVNIEPTPIHKRTFSGNFDNIPGAAGGGNLFSISTMTASAKRWNIQTTLRILNFNFGFGAEDRIELKIHSIVMQKH